MSDKVKILVTQEKFDEIFSIDDWINIKSLSHFDLYNKIVCFVVDENGQYVTVEQAREMFRQVPKKEWGGIVADFVKAVGDAFVNPTSGSS
jgi:hypothetical protein